jgi:hypothetical protein
MRHREKFRDEKVADCFPPTLTYYFSKIFEGIHSPHVYPLGAMHVDLVSDCLVRMKELLEKRGEWGIHDPVTYEYELLGYPLVELKAFFTDRSSSTLNDQDAYIFCSFIREQFTTLERIAKEFDDKYAASRTAGE